MKKRIKTVIDQKHKAFTLIELLVVVAIIGILATVVMMNLFNAKAKARDSQRVSDIKQIQIAVEMYKEVTGSYPGVSGRFYVSTKGTTTNRGWGSNVGGLGDLSLRNALIPTYTSSLPLDPKSGPCNISCTDAAACALCDSSSVGEQRYRYYFNSTGYEIDAGLDERGRGTKVDATDGGNRPGRYEVGTDLTILN